MFARIYLKDEDGNPLVPAPVHWEWYDLILGLYDGRYRYVGIQAPKNHAKSTIFSKVLPLWLTCAIDPNIRQVNGSVNSDLAERFLRANRRELETNPLLIEDFGPFKPERPEKWTQTELIVNRTSTSPSPTWRAVGSEKPVQGGRADWVIGDDLADLENSMTQRQRDKLQEWFDGDFLGTLEPDGRAVVIGTAKHNDDLLARIEMKAKEHPESGWVFRRYDAIVDEQKHTTLWPARWPWDALMAKKAAIGTLTFNRDYRNVAVNDETSLFPYTMLYPARRRDLKMEERYSGTDTITAAIDYAFVEDEREAQASDSDFTVVQVWQLTPERRRRLLWVERRRGMTPLAQRRLIESTLRRYSNLRIAISEANQAQRVQASELLRQTGGELPIVPHVTGRGVRVDVYEGVPSLVALFEQGMIELPYGDERSREMVDIFIEELHGLGVERHDDMVMTFWLNEVGVRKLNSTLSWGKVKTRR